MIACKRGMSECAGTTKRGPGCSREHTTGVKKKKGAFRNPTDVLSARISPSLMTALTRNYSGHTSMFMTPQRYSHSEAKCPGQNAMRWKVESDPTPGLRTVNPHPVIWGERLNSTSVRFLTYELEIINTI